jgi:hypothetical protein
LKISKKIFPKRGVTQKKSESQVKKMESWQI